MLTLLLLRHAKSSRDDPDLADFDRPLNPRGTAAAKAMRSYMVEHKLRPDLVLCSASKRTQQTWALASAGFSPAPPVQMEQAIFEMDSSEALRDFLLQKGGSAHSLLLVGHSPSIGELAERLVARGDETARVRMSQKFSTGALAIIDFEIASWQSLSDASGNLRLFIRPRDLD